MARMMDQTMTRLSEEARQAGERITAAQAAATDEMKKAVNKARDAAMQRAQQLRMDTADQDEKTERSWQQAKDSWQRHIAEMKAKHGERMAKMDAKTAEKTAEHAERYADQTANFALSAIDEAEYAALDAIVTREAAQEAKAAAD